MRSTLYNPQQAKGVIDALWMQAKAQLMAGRRMVVTLKEETRRDGQNKKFHAICGDLEKSKFPWMGKPRTAAQWKVLLISGHAVATKLGAEMVPGLENEFVNIRESSAQMSIARMNSLIEYAYAMGTQLGVRFTATEYE